MVVVRPEGGIALGALAVPCLVTRLQTVETEDMETLGQNSILLVRFASRTGQLFLYKPNKVANIKLMSW